MELPSIQSFKLANILKSIQDDSVDQLTQSILTLTNSFNNDLNQELLELIQFQLNNINSLLVKNSKTVKNFKHLKTLTKLNIEQELVQSIEQNSTKAKELIEKLYKLEKLLPVKERLFNDVNSHKLHYPLLYETGSRILDLNDDVVSLDEQQDQEVEQELDQEPEPNQELEPELEPELESSTIDNTVIRDQLQDLQEIYNTPHRAESLPENLKDRRISILSKNIDDIISERVQQQQLQSIIKPTSLIFPTQLTKKTSSQFNEDVRLILIKDANEKQVIFGLKKFL